ncbi:FtsB family cell division protein [Falsiporphyromonas endometrii]
MGLGKMSELYRRIKVKLKQFNEWQKHHPLFKYAAALVLMLVFTFSFGENNIYQSLKKSARLIHLDNEIERLDEQYKHDSLRLVEVENDKDGVEHKARLRFMMKAPDEQVYIISDSDELVEQPAVNQKQE